MDPHDHRRACVARVPVFAALDDDALDEVAAAAVSRRHPRGEQVQGPGDEPALLVVHRGRVRVSRISASGAQQVLRVLQPGDFVGETAVLTGAGVTDLAEALDEVEVCRLTASDARRLIRENPALALQVVGELAARLRQAEDRLSAGATASVARRLADRLLQLADEQGVDAVRLPSTKKDLAAWLGTSPETLSRRLGQFQDEGLVRVLRDGRIRLVDRDGLARVPNRA